MTLLLVRHAQSAANARGVFTGGRDEPLTEIGRAQAAALANRLAAVPIAAVYASALSRARDTARPTAERFGLEVQVLDGLAEARLGEAEGLAWADVRARWTIGAGATWADGIPGAEGGAAVRARVAALLETLLERHRDEVALCISHAGTITHALQHALGMPLEATGPRFRIFHAALNVVEWSPGGPLLIGLNDRCHLDVLEG